ncbi:ribosomal protein S7 [Dentipellis sp. KUC8613]|nr:ribosomal protein S7 [Dentipellis sp. KUC8613]
MLSPLRQVGRRSLLTFARPLSTATPPPQPSSSSIPSSEVTINIAPVYRRPVLADPPRGLAINPRTGQPPLLDIPPAEDPLLQYITDFMQFNGKRKRAQRTVSRMLLWLHTFTRQAPLPILREAVRAAAPAVRSISHKHGGKTVVRPVALKEKQRVRFAVDWILKASKSKSGQTVEERMAREVIAVLQGSSSVLDAKRRVHEVAMVNRGNAQSRV